MSKNIPEIRKIYVEQRKGKETCFTPRISSTEIIYEGMTEAMNA